MQDSAVREGFFFISEPPFLLLHTPIWKQYPQGNSVMNLEWRQGKAGLVPFNFLENIGENDSCFQEERTHTRQRNACVGHRARANGNPCSWVCESKCVNL